MFYCNKCALKNEWPLTMSVSRGNCEDCGKLADCYDTPSRYLPVLKEKPVEEKKPTAADKPGDTAIGALRWLDRNATIIKAGNSPVFAEKFDKALDLLWEAIINGH